MEITEQTSIRDLKSRPLYFFLMHSHFVLHQKINTINGKISKLKMSRNATVVPAY